MKISASQVKTYVRCPRLWFWEKVAKLPQPPDPGYHFTFGKVLHAVAERYLLADDNGVDPETGEPVDLFPPTWKQDPDDPTKVVTDEDADHIQALIDLAVTQGTLMRLPGRQVEREFTRKILPTVKITGFIDHELENEVHDHKTAKASRWTLSQKKLKVDLQMNVYAAVKFLESPGLDTVRVRHNVFFKQEVRVKATEALITRTESLKFWSDLKDLAKEMKKLRGIPPKTPWKRIPAHFPDACGAYGGCKFQTICVGRETTTQYSRRMAKLHARQAVELTPSQKVQAIFDALPDWNDE